MLFKSWVEGSSKNKTKQNKEKRTRGQGRQGGDCGGRVGRREVGGGGRG